MKIDLQSASNSLNLQVKPSPEGAIVGDFILRNEIVSDEPDAKIIRLIIEGNGQLSTFDFPPLEGPKFSARKLSTSINAKIDGENLVSKKLQEIEVVPAGFATTIVLPEVKIQEFNPQGGNLSQLKLPASTFHFQLPGAVAKTKAPYPEFTNSSLWTAFLLLAFFAAFIYLKRYRPRPFRTQLRLHRLFSNKNLKLQISKSAARSLYQQIAIQIAQHDGERSTLMETVRHHLPQEEWLNVNRGLRKLQQTAYSPAKAAPMTYEELKSLCEKIEMLWQR
jgi:hypothetical protein